MQCLQIIEGIYLAKLTGVDKAHVNISYLGTLDRLVEHRIFAMHYGSLKSLFTNIIIKGCSGLAQEECESIPMINHVLYRLAQFAVWLNLFLGELFIHPELELLHKFGAMRLMVAQTFIGGYFLVAAVRIVGVDHGQDIDHVVAFLGEMLHHINEAASAVGQA